MYLHEELYFEITLEGEKDELKKFEAFATSGVFDDFFEIEDDYLIYDDDFDEGGKARLVFTNDEYGIEITKFNPEDFLDILCPAAKALDVRGSFYDVEDEEYRFESPVSDSGYTDADSISLFNDELDAKLLEEERAANDDEDEE